MNFNRVYRIKDMMDKNDLKIIMGNAEATIKSGVEWIVYEYTSDYYEGYGVAIAKDYDNNFWMTDIGHDSVVEKIDGEWEKLDKDYFLDFVTNPNAFNDMSEKMLSKLSELTGGKFLEA